MTNSTEGKIQKHPVMKNNDLILNKIKSLLKKGHRKRIIESLRQLANDYAVKVCLPLDNIEFHPGYIVCILPETISTDRFVNEFGENERYEFVKGTTIIIKCGYSRRFQDDVKKEILERYGKDTLWVWAKRDGTAVLDRNKINNVMRDCFVEEEKELKSYVKQPEENYYDTLPAALVSVGNNPYVRFLNENQSKRHKILSFEEIRIVNKKPMAEIAYLFTILTPDDYCLLVWENTNEKRATIVFRSTLKTSHIALGALYSFATSNLKNKREKVATHSPELITEYGLDFKYYRLTHLDFETWRKNLLSEYLPTNTVYVK